MARRGRDEHEEFLRSSRQRTTRAPDEGAINTGIVLDFEGVEFANGAVVVKWRSLSPFRHLWEFYSSSAGFQDEQLHLINPRAVPRLAGSCAVALCGAPLLILDVALREAGPPYPTCLVAGSAS